MNQHRCVSCGSVLPYYGIDVCWACEHGYTPDVVDNNKEANDDARIFERTENRVSEEE